MSPASIQNIRNLICHEEFTIGCITLSVSTLYNNIRLLKKLEYDQNYFNQMYLWKINLKIVILF